MKATRKRCQILSFSVHPDKEGVLEMLEEMAQRERKSKSQIILRCIEYYYKTKWPGNPQPPLFPIGEKPSHIDETLLEARTRKVMVFLRFNAKLSYDQIAKIVGRSRKYVWDFIKSLDYRDFDNRRKPRKKQLAKAFRRNLEKYKEAFQEVLDGKKEVWEAFKF